MQKYPYDLRTLHKEMNIKSMFMNWSKLILAKLDYPLDYDIRRVPILTTYGNDSERRMYVIAVTEEVARYITAKHGGLAHSKAFHTAYENARITALPTTQESGKVINHLLTKLEDTLTTIPNLVLQELKHWHTSQKQREDKLLNLDYLHEYEAQLLANIASKIKLDPAILKRAEPFRTIPEQDKL